MPGEYEYKEKEWLLQIAAGNKQAFTWLYEHHAPWLTRYIQLFTDNAADTEEILQDVFVKVWNKREQLPGMESFGGWLNRVARNTIFNYLRSLKLRYKLEVLDDGNPQAAQDRTDDRVLLHQYYNIAQQAIDQLPPRRKEVFMLRLEQNLTMDEIAAQLGVSRSAVEQHVYAANAFIKDYLQKHAGIKMLLILFMSLLDY